MKQGQLEQFDAVQNRQNPKANGVYNQHDCYVVIEEKMDEEE